MNKTIKFRQYIGPAGGFHYWGYFDGKDKGFITPLTSVDEKNQIPESSQFTGLLDRKEKEIYEGDKVKWDDLVYKIVFEDGGFMLTAGKDFTAIPLITRNSKLIVVIGNIYENPELV